MYITTNHNLNQQLQHQQLQPPPPHQNDDNLMSTSSSASTTTTTSSSSEDFTTLENKNMSKKLISMCFGCGNQITDQFILRVAPDLEWHAKCLKCFECGQYLDESCTCFVRNGKTYCKLDYLRLFSKKCFRCKEGFKKNDFVMRANSRIYHVECFRCFMCNKQLAPGDEFAAKEDGLLCKLDNENFEKHSLQQHQLQQQNASSLINLQPVNVAGASSLASSSASSSAPSSSSASPSLNNSNNAPSTNNTSCQNITNLQQMSSSLLAKNCDDLNINTVDYEDNQNCLSPSLNHHQTQQQFHTNMLNSPHSRHLQQQQQQSANAASSSSTSSSSSNSSHLHSSHHAQAAQSSSGQATTSGGGGGGGHHRKDKTTRVRTVLNEKQLHTLRTCYGANPRPDALMKEQLVEMTGLSPRVIRVWFQNKRCKDKKKTILIKQMQEQQKNRQTIGHGIPLIAGSPLRNDMNNLGPGSQVEMQHTSNAYLHHQSSHLSWKQMDGYGMNGQLMEGASGGAIGPGMSGANSNGQLMPPYDQMMGFQSDEEDCFDQLSDQGGDDSVSSVGLDDTRIQQL